MSTNKINLYGFRIVRKFTVLIAHEVNILEKSKEGAKRSAKLLAEDEDEFPEIGLYSGLGYIVESEFQDSSIEEIES